LVAARRKHVEDDFAQGDAGLLDPLVGFALLLVEGVVAERIAASARWYFAWCLQ
jgi:hypothetical protein